MEGVLILDGYSVEVIKEIFPVESGCSLYLGEKDANGFFKQHAIQTQKLKEILYMYYTPDNKDVYITKNLFDDKGHSKENLKMVTNIVIDIDCHHEINSKKRDLLLEDLVKEIDAELEHKRMYDILIFTGRGLHYYFHFKAEEYTPDTENLYKSTAEAIISSFENIVSKFSELEIDKGCSKSETGFVRLPATYNREAKTYSKIKSYNKLKEIGLKELYSIFIELADIKVVEAMLLTKKQARNRRMSLLKVESEFNTKNMLEKRLQFLKKVQDIRKFEKDKYGNKLNNEMRKVTLFLYYCTAYEMLKSTEEARVLTERFNQDFNRPVRIEKFNEVIRAINSQILKDNKARWFKNQTFINLLEFNVNENEQASKYFYLLYRDNKSKKAEAKKAKEEDTQKRNSNILYLYKHGKTQSEIAKLLECSLREVNVQLKDIDLTKSEQTLLNVQKCKTKGLSQTQTSKKLSISIRTVKSYWNT